MLQDRAQFGRPGSTRERAAHARLLPFGIAHFGKSLFWHSGELVFAFFLTEHAGVPAVWMGAVLAGGMLLSAAIDLAMGWHLCGAAFTLARACRLQFFGACISAAAITPLFAADLLPESWRLAWTGSLAIAFRIAYALYDIPQNATLSLATRDADARARLAALRLFFSGLASIVVATALAWLVRGGADPADGRFAFAALLMSAVAIATAWRLTRIGASADMASAGAIPARISARTPVGGAAPLLLTMFLLSAATSVFGRLEPYYVTYRWHGHGGTILIAASLGFALGQPLWLAAIRRVGFGAGFCAAAIALAVAALGFTLSAVSGYIPQALFAFAFGAANGGISTALWASYADRVAAHHPAAAPFAFATLTATSKLGLAAASGLVAVWLSQIDYRAGGLGLDVAMAGFPIAGALASLAVLAFARLRATAVR
ncbi:MAG: MFS transporter [Pseudomonadota bacterium]